VLQQPNGTAVFGATVTILGHPESSNVTTRNDGWFDIPVNGGGLVTVQIQPPSGESPSLLPVQRHVQTSWHQYSVLPDIWLTPYDPNPNPITPNSSNYQIATASTLANSADTNGSPMTNRTAQVLFPPGTGASFTYGQCGSGGTCSSGQCNTITNVCTGSQVTTPLTVRATEYTAGPNGPSAMPGDLPPSTAFTYAVALTADEAIAAGAAGISFSNNANNAVVFYVENFLGFNDGSVVPVGWYNTAIGSWVPSTDGSVIQITGFSTGASNCGGYSQCAQLSQLDQSLGLSAAELNQLAVMYASNPAYASGVSLWRVTTSHFTDFDLNVPPAAATAPAAPPAPTPFPPPPLDNPCLGSGSIIECENQILAQELPLAGTPFSLRYQSDRAPGRVPTITIPLTDASIPPGLNSVIVNIEIVGVLYSYEFDGPLQPNQSFTWTWNRLDPYGNTVQGLQQAKITVLYAYLSIVQNVYVPPAVGEGARFHPLVAATTQGTTSSFGNFPSSTDTPAAGSRLHVFVYPFTTFLEIGVEDAEPLGLGGWTLSANHIYDPDAHVLWGGDGKRRTVEAASSLIMQTVAGTTCSPDSGDGSAALTATFGGPVGSIATAPDGSYYVSDNGNVRKIDSSGNIHHYAGTNTSSQPCSGICPAASSWVGYNPPLAVGLDGGLYVASYQALAGIIQRIDPTTNNITTIAGSPSSTQCTGTTLGQVVGLSAAPDGSVWIADQGCEAIRRLGTDGSLRTVTGTVGECPSLVNADGNLASGACFQPTSVAVGPDGTAYVTDTACEVHRIDPQTGMMTQYAGLQNSTCAPGPGGPPSGSDGLGAKAIQLGRITAMSVGVDGTLYMSDVAQGVIWSVDPKGFAHIVAGGPSTQPLTSDNGGPAQMAWVPLPQAVAVGANGGIYEADNQCRVREIVSAFPSYSPGAGIAYSIPSEDGSQLFGFDASGRHLATYDGRMGPSQPALLTFNYNPATNQLASVVDANNNTTSFSYSSSTTTITPPSFGQTNSSQTQTVLALDSTGHATTITDPAGEPTQCQYSTGLMTQLTTPAGNQHNFTYDGLGNLLSDQDPAGTQFLTRTFPATPPANTLPGYDWTTAVLSGAGHTTSHVVTQNTNGLVTQTTVSPSGATGSYARSVSDVRTQTRPDGTVATTTMAPDPRFVMLDPYPGTVSVSTPAVGSVAGQTLTQTWTRTSNGPGTTPTAILDKITQWTTPSMATGNTTQIAYANVAGTLPTVTYTSPQGRVLQETLDGQGRIVQIGYPTSTQLGTTILSYGASGGRLSSVATSGTTAVGPTTRTWAMRYDSPGFTGYLAALQDPAGNTTTYETRDNVGRPTTVWLPDHTLNPNSLYSVVYDLDGNATWLTVPPATSGSSSHEFTPNTLDLLGTYTPPQVNPALNPISTTYNYNADHQITSIVVPESSGSLTTSYNYDSFGRLSSILDQSSGVAREFTYNSSDQLQTATREGSSVLTNTYQGFLKTGTQWTGNVTGSVARTYDNFFRVTSQTINTASPVNYTYDNDNLFTGTSSPGPAFTVTRDYANYYGRVTGSTLGAVSDSMGSASLPGYNGFGELTNYSATTNAGATTTVYALSNVLRDSNGRITSMTEAINGINSEVNAWSLVYDARGRLTAATRGSNPTNQYGYDPNGNRTTLNGNTWTYDAQDRLLTAAPSLSFTYTNDGTAVTKLNGNVAYTYTYDLSGVLIEAMVPPANGYYRRVNYAVDALNRRIGRTVTWDKPIGQHAIITAINQGFLYDDKQRVVAELNSSGGVTSIFVYGTRANVPDYMYQPASGLTYRIISDWVGSVRLVINATPGSSNVGQVMQQLDYDEFGNVLATSVDNSCAATVQCFPFQPFGFAGGLQDRESGLVRFGVRDYDPQVGRWISKDPIRFHGGGTNLYAYAGGDPINHIDPAGEFWWIVAGALVGAAVDIGIQLSENGGNFGALNGAEVGVSALVGAGAGFGGEFLFGSLFSATSVTGSLVAVTQYGGDDAAGSPWVMVGGNTARNWLMSGSPELGYQMETGVTTYVDQEQLSYPDGVEWAKGLIGQRICK
jgi:RHS repeat-associated protein